VLAFAHIGDLHITDANQPNFLDFMSITSPVDHRLMRGAAQRVAGDFEIRARSSTGDDAATIRAWSENGIFGTQLGPNRNGRKW
jgi:hypothetical protein